MTSKKDREIVVNRMKMQLYLANYGLPDLLINGKKKQAEPLGMAEATKKYRAIQELFVRFNLYVATGKHDQGVIHFPEARRNIEYLLSGRSAAGSGVKLHSLVANK
jgi:hypothetical protein